MSNHGHHWNYYMVTMHKHCFLLLITIACCIVPAGSDRSYSLENETEDTESLNREMVRLFQQERYAEAIPIAKKIHYIREQTLGPEHPRVAQSLNNLAELYRHLGDLSTGEMLLKRALAIAEKALGPEHPGVKIIANNLAGLYEAQGNHAEALALRERSAPGIISDLPTDSTITKKNPPPETDSAVPLKQPVPAVEPAAHTTHTGENGDWIDLQTALMQPDAPSYPYSVKLGSFRTLARAEKAIGIYGKQGVSPYWTLVDLQEKGQWYRFFTGYFETRGQAEEFRQELGLSEAIIEKTEYAALVGTYTSSEKLAKMIGTLKDLKYLPYVIEDQNGRSRLFVGAFMLRERAEKKREELKTHQIQSLVVTR